MTADVTARNAAAHLRSHVYKTMSFRTGVESLPPGRAIPLQMVKNQSNNQRLKKGTNDDDNRICSGEHN